VHQIRFGFAPHATVFPSHFHGLANCAGMLASTAGGSRLLQEAVEMDADEAMKALLLEPFKADVWRTSLSPHGNYVLQKFVTCMFPRQVQFIVDSFRGRVAEAAENQMQSRILERLLEYCPSEQTAGLVAEALSIASTLLRHPFGNFVLQAVLEHGLDSHRAALAQVICQDVERLARHPIASNSVRKALQTCSPKDQGLLMRTLLADPQRFAVLSKHKTGSFVARELKKLQKQLSR
jgi:mRNA-binding protein PUF3